MPAIAWLPEALDDLERLHEFLEDKNPKAAARAITAIREGAAQLRKFPRLGRPMPDNTGRRELFIAFGGGAYVLRYMLENKNAAVIIRVWHSREDRADE
ncbi:MAG TPA: type II toxin-antitoxin system RelE/ParE family toxin [Alphaproteobacteria bacterium]|nr:type II toxin-antitoxin system RelE/ParE family toxin [Alphaproteobacteria bacterium]